VTFHRAVLSHELANTIVRFKAAVSADDEEAQQAAIWTLADLIARQAIEGCPMCARKEAVLN
jgi:hypothetical protein